MNGMKRLIFPIFLISLLFSACTSSEDALKKQAIEVGQQKFNEMVQGEADEYLKHSEWLHKLYINFMRSSSEVDVETIKMTGSDKASVALIMNTYPLRQRQIVLEIAAKVPSSKVRRFSFSEAFTIVAAQKGEKKELTRQSLLVLNFRKTSNGWAAE